MSIKQDLIDSERRAAQQRARMGAKEYDEWVKSRQTQYYTLFKSESEVKEFMRKAGYDYKRIDTGRFIYIKTHIGSDDYDCVWWLYRGNEILAVINNYVDESYIKTYIEKVENVMGKKVFFLSISDRNIYKNKLSKQVDTDTKPVRQSITTVVKMQITEPEPEYTFPTIYTDKSILKQALKNADITATMKGDNFEFLLDGFDASIYRQGGSNYEFKVIGKCNLKAVHKHFSKIETEYNKVVQHNICENIKNKVAKSPTMRLEQEEVLEDNSVLITIRI
ncbi:hypothetical protein IKP85_02650 [bacterium]|nr:hypothetical protein [bacterium]